MKTRSLLHLAGRSLVVPVLMVNLALSATARPIGNSEDSDHTTPINEEA